MSAVARRWAGARRYRYPIALFAPACLVLFGVSLAPSIYALYLSFVKVGARSDTFVGLGNFARLASDSQFWDSLRTTALFVGGAVGAELVLGFGLALLLNHEIPGKGLLQVAAVLPMATTPIVVALAWRLMYNSAFGIFNYVLSLVHVPAQGWLGDSTLALPAVMIVDIWEWTPFLGFILLSGLQSLPREPMEAARVDGASDLQILRWVTIPQLSRVFRIAIALRLIDSVKTFDILYGMTGGGPGTATETTNLYAFMVGFQWADLGYAAAIAVVLLFMVSAVTMLLLRPARE